LDGSPERFDPAVAAREYGRLQPAVEALRRAMQLGGPSYRPSEQPWLGGPAPSHVSDMRHAAMALMADMRWRVHSGQSRDLGERAAILFEFAAASSEGADFLNSLVG